MNFAIFGITNDGLNLAITLLIVCLVAIWLGLIVFTYLDARRRIEDPVLIGCATIASFFPFVGTIVYTILRPPEFLEDARERRLEMKSAELRVRHLKESSCPKCEYPVQIDWLRCPQCRTSLKEPCPSCGKPVSRRWTVCPYCESKLVTRKRERDSGAGRERDRGGKRERPRDRDRDDRGREERAREDRDRKSAGKSRKAPARTPSRKASPAAEEKPKSRPSRRKPDAPEAAEPRGTRRERSPNGEAGKRSDATEEATVADRPDGGAGRRAPETR